MSKEIWDHIKRVKRFYVSTYRRVANAIFFSVVLNIVLGLMVHHFYFNQPDRDFYSTNGITAPYRLTSMDEPNMQSVPLLSAQPGETASASAESETKEIPQ